MGRKRDARDHRRCPGHVSLDFVVINCPTDGARSEDNVVAQQVLPHLSLPRCIIAAKNGVCDVSVCTRVSAAGKELTVPETDRGRTSRRDRYLAAREKPPGRIEVENRVCPDQRWRELDVTFTARFSAGKQDRSMADDALVARLVII